MKSTLTVREMQTEGLRRCMVCGSGVEPSTRIHRSRSGYPYCEAHIERMPTYGPMLVIQAHDCSRCEAN